MKINGVTFITATRYDVLKKFAEVSLTFFFNGFIKIVVLTPTSMIWTAIPDSISIDLNSGSNINDYMARGSLHNVIP